MRGDIVFHLFGVHEGREKDLAWGTYRTRAEAEAEIAKLHTRVMNGENWAAKYHDRGFEIREHAVDTDFEPPPRPTPRSTYVIETEQLTPPDVWTKLCVNVLRRSDRSRVCSYERNHAMYQTFEPFRKNGRELALVSRDYVATAVLDLATGEVIAEEPHDANGFCPVGFYVPDYWDLHDGTVFPGSPHFREAEHAWIRGELGFVWGCVWGDDGSWKIQCVDLSRVSDGIITRDARFGYVELAESNWVSPCFRAELGDEGLKPPFIYAGREQVSLAVQLTFDKASGAVDEDMLAALKSKNPSGPA